MFILSNCLYILDYLEASFFQYCFNIDCSAINKKMMRDEAIKNGHYLIYKDRKFKPDLNHPEVQKRLKKQFSNAVSFTNKYVK